MNPLCDKIIRVSQRRERKIKWKESNHGESESYVKVRHVRTISGSVLQQLFTEEDMMYIKCFLLLKLFSLAIALPIHDDNTNGKVTPLYASSIYPATISKRIDRSPDGSRIDFQIRNHQGPGTYIFGFDTGHGKNRQYKMEERRQDGSVKGRYGFYDAKGKLKIVSYIAGPTGNYQERHHETIISQI